MPPKQPPNTTWETAIAATPRPSEPDAYDVTVASDWSISNLPLGGYLTAILTSATRTHFALHHPTLNQPDPITTHCAFISRASDGAGIVRISVSKPGRQYSNVVARLTQLSKSKAEVLIVEAMITQGNLARERTSGGISLSVPDPIAATDVFKRSEGAKMVTPPQWMQFTAAADKLRRVLPAGTVFEGKWSQPKYGPHVRDEWVSWNEGSSVGKGGFDTQAVVMLMDNFRPTLYNFEGIDMAKTWMATLTLTVDVKRGPPEGKDGWEWLFLRAVVGKCEFGRYSMDMWLLDEEGHVVAIGRRAELILSQDRRIGEKSRM